MATAPSQGDPIFSTLPPLTATMQGVSGFPIGWDPITRIGMLPEGYVASTSGQNNSADSQHVDPQQNMLATQPMAQDALQLQQNTTGPTPVSQVNASASPPIPQQTNTTLRPTTPSEYLASKIPHQGGVTWVFHDAVTGHVRHVNVPYFYPGLQQMNHQATLQPAATNQMVLYHSPSNQNTQYALEMKNNQSVNTTLPRPASTAQPATAQPSVAQPSASPQAPSATQLIHQRYLK